MADAQITILCIDDNPTNRYVVQRYLANSGFRVTEAESGAAGLEAIAQSPPDLVILDVHLPDISGFEICQQLKQNPMTAGIPVLHLSAAYTRSTDRAQGLESGADAYLVQPVEAVELIATIHALLRLYEAERTAQKQAREWQATFDAMNDGVCLLDATGCVQRCNQALEQLLQQSRAQLHGRHYLDLVPLSAEAGEAALSDSPSKTDALRDRFALSQLQTTEQRARIEVPFSLTSGESGWLALTLDAIFDDTGKLTGAVYIATDITLQKRAAVERERLLIREQEARTASENANRLKDEFLATLSHELRSPLNAILGWTNLLKNRPFDPSRAAQALEIIERNTRTQTQLIEDLLDVSRIIQGKLQLNIQPVNLGMLITTTLETIRPAAAAKSIQLQFQNFNSTALPEHPQPSPLKVLGDRDRLQQVIWNLLSNAVKFTPTGGQVEIRLIPVWVEEGKEGEGDKGGKGGKEEQPNSAASAASPAAPASHSDSPSPSNSAPSSSSSPTHLQITITDTGKGIAPAFLPHVFDRFRQADSSITRQYGGLGLGLSIVRHLIELHGGTVAATSPGEGQGATFTVQLPILIMPAVPGVAGSDPTTSDLPSLLGLTVLVVDDEADSRSYITTLLELQEATVIAVSSTEKIPQILQQSAVNVLVSDIGMPDEDGYSLIRRIRALAPEYIPQAIALTGYARSEDRERALAAGFQAYLTKPVEPDVLIQAIATLVES